jgi:hypothetical protein
VFAKPDLLRPRSLVLVFALWLTLMFAGLGALWVYSSTPGRQGTPPAQWPVSSCLKRVSGQSTLVMFVHPQCPCSQASMSELSIILAHSAGRLQADVVFLRPPGEPESWTHTVLWRTASALPETPPISDPEGREAQLFQAFVSGETLVYDSSGNLRFHGGITDSRGHEGDNPGCSSIQAYLNTGTVPLARTSVFGCPLFNDSMR